MLRFLRYVCEVVAGFVAVSIVLVVLLTWRLNTMPATSDFLTPYVETVIGEILPGSQVHVGTTLMTWDRKDRALAMRVATLQVSDADGQDIADVPEVDARLSVLALIFGHFMPTDLVIDHPQLKLYRDDKGTWLFAGHPIGQGGAGSDDITAILHHLSDRLNHAELMHKLAVTGAQLDVHDDFLKKDWSLEVPEIVVTRNAIGKLDSHIGIQLAQKEATAKFDFHYAYDPLKRVHEFSSTFSDITPAFFANTHPEAADFHGLSSVDLPLTGHVEVAFDRDFSVISARGHVHADEGHIIYPAMWDKPLLVQQADINADYDGLKHTLSVTSTQLKLNGPILGLTVEGTPSQMPGQDLHFSTTLTVDNLPMNRYDELWPKPVLSHPRYWLAANLRNGTFTHADVTVKGSLAWKDLANINIEDGGGKLAATGASVTYLDGMPPAENVSANGTFDLKKMNVAVTSGGLGNIHLLPFSIAITGLADDDQYIDIPLQISGPVPDIMKLLDHQPLGYAKKLGITPEDLAGQIEGSVHFYFPLLKTLEMKDLKIDADAHASDVASTKLIPGLAIDQGDGELTLSMDGFRFKGGAGLDKVPFQIDWQEYFAATPGKPLRHATVTGPVKDDQWNNFGISYFNGTKGNINVTLDLTRTAKNRTVYTGVLDMAPAAVNVDMLGWKKNAGAPAMLKFTATQLGNKPIEISGLSLRGPQIAASGSAVFSSDLSQLLALNLSPLTLGRTNADIHFTQSYGTNGFFSFSASGPALDLGGFRGGKDPAPADTRPKDFHLQVGKLYVGNIGEFDQIQASASRDKDGWTAISMQGFAENDAAFNLELTPQPSGFTTLKATCDNFGEAMKSLGFTDTIKGGKLSVSGQSTVDNPRSIQGNFKVKDFTVQKLPALGLLLNATSPYDLFKGFINDSADFTRLGGDFRWQGQELQLSKVNASGTSVGININGKIDMDSGDANLTGTLVPFSLVNGILNYIPLLGDILTGGENQGVLAVEYTIAGQLSAPKVSVNPVSLLTPGFIRNLFFGGDEDKLDEAQ